MSRRYAAIIAIGSLIHGALGVYLMRENNIAVKLCYPPGGVQPSDKDIELVQDQKPVEKPESSKDTKGDEQKYAPPGYYT